jgi:hypothetical protein
MQFWIGLLHSRVAARLIFNGSLMKEVPMDIVRSNVFTIVTMKDITPCSLLWRQMQQVSPKRWWHASRSVGLWRWYVNITITIMDIIHRPVFYLKTQPNSISLSVPHRKHIMSPLRAQKVNAIHRPVFYLKQDVSEIGFCFRLQVQPTQVSPIETVCLRTLAGNGDRIQVPKRVLNERHDDG